MNDRGRILFFSPEEGAGTGAVPSGAKGSISMATGEDMAAAGTLDRLIDGMLESGFDPVTQLAGYLIAEDPTLLPENPELRALCHHLGRDKLLETLIELYMAHRPGEA